jgi:excisionase family DNA binding protein
VTNLHAQGVNFLSVKETAHYLKVSEPTVYRLLRFKAIKAAKVGGQWRIPVSELLKFIEEQINMQN